MRARTWLARGASAFALLASPAVHAQGDAAATGASSSAPERDTPIAIAEALFRTGRELMAGGRYAEACPKFAESQRLDPKPGTLLNLALCHEKTGRTASAWAEYVDSAEVAHAAGEADREKVAVAHAAALEPRLAHVIIDASAAPGARVTLDDRVIGDGAFQTPIPIDPGDHVLGATASGKKPSATTFTITSDPGTTRLRVPALEDEPLEGAAPPPAPTFVPAPSSGAAGAGRRTWGFVVGGAGLALIGAGAAFGALAFVEKHTANDECDNAKSCTQRGLDAIRALKTFAATSTITIAAGALATGAGLYLVLGAPRRGGGGTTWRAAPDLATRGIRVRLDW